MSHYLKRTLFLPVTALLLLSHAASAETLAEIYSLAKNNDTLIRSQEATYMAGLESRKIARSALLPHLSLNGTYSEGDINNHLTDINLDSESEEYDFTLSQTLFDMKSWYGYKQGKYNSAQAEVDYATNKQDLILRVVHAYTNVLQKIDNYTTAKAEENAIARQLEQTRQRFEVGLIAITDVHESQASYDNAVVNSLNARGEIGVAFEELDSLTGQRIQAIAPLREDFAVVNPEPLDREAWVEKALVGNTELESSKLSMQAAHQRAKSKTSGHLPTITATYQYQNNDSDLDPGFLNQTDQEGDVVSINMKIPIFAGGRTSAERREAWHQYNAAKELYANTQRNTVQSARSLHLAVTTDVSRVRAQKQAIVSSQSALDATKAGYDAGTRNIVDVLNAERLLYQSLRGWHTARYKYINDLLQLKKTAGELEPDSIELANSQLNSESHLARADYE
jgi:outer membrane protein